MKKWAILLIAAVLGISAAAAQAPVESISAIHTTKVVKITGSGEEALPDGFVIFPVESKAAIRQQIRRFYDFVNDTEASKPPVFFFLQEQQRMIEKSLPRGVLSEMLQVNEIQSIDELNYTSEIGDVRAEFEFATFYDVKAHVSILLGLTYVDVSKEWDEKIDWNTNTEWWVLETEALENGDLLILFPQEVLEKMMVSSATTMIVFNEPF